MNIQKLFLALLCLVSYNLYGNDFLVFKHIALYLDSLSKNPTPERVREFFEETGLHPMKEILPAMPLLSFLATKVREDNKYMPLLVLMVKEIKNANDPKLRQLRDVYTSFCEREGNNSGECNKAEVAERDPKCRICNVAKCFQNIEKR